MNTEMDNDGQIHTGIAIAKRCLIFALFYDGYAKDEAPTARELKEAIRVIFGEEIAGILSNEYGEGSWNE